MSEQVLGTAINKISNEINLPSVEVTNKSIASDNSRVSMAARNVGAKNLEKKETEKKKYVCSTGKNSGKITEQKTEDGTNSTIAGEKSNDYELIKTLRRDSKRKTAAKEMSESVADSETEDDTSPVTVGEIINDSEEKKDASANEPTGKTITKKFIDVTESETKDDTNQMDVDENIDNSKQDQNISTQNLKRKTAAHPPTSEMVLEAFKNLKKCSGASAEEIVKYVEENYQVNINRIKPHINRFLLQGVATRLLEKVSASGTDSKFKIKKVEKIKKEPGKVGKVKGKVNGGTGKAKNVAGKAKKDKKVTAKTSTRNYVK